MPIWNKELDALAFESLGLKELQPVYKILISVGVLTVITSLIMIIIACICCLGMGSDKEEITLRKV
jgi:hypothetical protein